jgi:hypothetical protein
MRKIIAFLKNKIIIFQMYTCFKPKLPGQMWQTHRIFKRFFLLVIDLIFGVNFCQCCQSTQRRVLTSQLFAIFLAKSCLAFSPVPSSDDRAFDTSTALDNLHSPHAHNFCNNSLLKIHVRFNSPLFILALIFKTIHVTFP